MEQHLLLFSKMIRNLESSDIQMDERFNVFYLLQSMPRSYSQLVTVLETLAEEQCTLNFVKATFQNGAMT